MTILTNQETTDLQRRLESLAEVFLFAGHPISTGSACFRTDISVFEIRKLLSEAWHQLRDNQFSWTAERDATKKISELERYLEDLDEQPLECSALCALAKNTINAAIDIVMSEARAGKVFEGTSAALMRAGVERLPRKDILKAVMETTNLEALEDEKAVRKLVIGSLVALLQRELMYSLDALEGY